MIVSVNKETGLVVRHAEVPKHRSAGTTKDINQFLELVSAAFSDFQRRIGVAADKQVTVKYITPREYVESPDNGLDIVLFKLIRRYLWNSSNTTKRTPTRPTYHAQIPDPNDPNLRISEYIDKRDNDIEFTVYSKHSKRANDLAIMFENFMRAYTWYFKEMGIDQINYLERLEDEVKMIGNDEFSIRPIRYTVTTQSVVQETTRKISEIKIDYDIGLLMQSKTTSEDPEVVEHSIIHGSEE